MNEGGMGVSNRVGDNEGVRARSGEVMDDDPLVRFLYLLMRDHLSVGVVEGLAPAPDEYEQVSEYTNGWLATYAQDVAARLKGKTP